MDILLDILIIVAAVIIIAIISLGIIILFAIIFRNREIVKYPITYIQECNGNCNECNEELKAACKES